MDPDARFGPAHVRRPGSRVTRQLAQFLGLIASFEDELSAIQGAVEHTAEVFDAETAALVQGGAVAASVGFPAGAVPDDSLVAVAEGRAESVYLRGLGSCRAISMPLEDPRLVLVVARSGAGGFNEEEADLLRGMGQVLTVGLRALRLLDEDRGRNQRLALALAALADLAHDHAHAIEEVAREASHDGVTGLPNRALLRDRAEDALSRSRRTARDACVLFVDLDGFKTINDSLGPAAGDELLRSVARRLSERCGPSDTVARLGGDEFAVLLDEVEGHDDAAGAAGRVLDAFTQPFELGGREVFASASVGIAVGGAGVDEMLRNANLALYRAKAKGRARFEAFEPQLHTAAFERLELEHDLTRAIEREQLQLDFQPIFDLRAQHVSALEALVRWRHPARGLLGPETFVPLAEETGQVIELGQWVLGAACHQAALWRAKYPAYSGLQVCVNLSGVELQEPGLASNVEAALRASQLDASGLVLEITETVLMDDTVAGVRRLERLKELGVRLVMDDFGTGYSSLRYLDRFPLDGLKIERSFTARVGGAAEEPGLVRAIADLGRVFGLSVVAEGVERPEQPARLLELGCGFAQGHHFSPALPAHEAEELLLRAGLLGPPPDTTPRPVAPLAELAAAAS